MFQPYSTLAQLPYKPAPADWANDMTGVMIVEEVAGRKPEPGHAFCKIMSGTSNDQFRKWCFDNKTVCIPFNVIMVEITFGGSNGPICHGAGFSTSTLSDLVVEVQYVDANGDLQIVNDPEELRAASGCFGLLGVVVALTLNLDKMAVAELAPTKIHMALAIPPPSDYSIPLPVQKMIKKARITETQLTQARDDFINRCKNDYYLEWFWFPYQNKCWVNTWKSA